MLDYLYSPLLVQGYVTNAFERVMQRPTSPVNFPMPGRFLFSCEFVRTHVLKKRREFNQTFNFLYMDNVLHIPVQNMDMMAFFHIIPIYANHNKKMHFLDIFQTFSFKTIT